MTKKVEKKVEPVLEREGDGQEEPVSEGGGKGVLISSLAPLQAFKYKGDVFTKRRSHPGGVRALSEKGDEIITLAPDTTVTPV